MNSDLLHILQHSLGLDGYGRPSDNYTPSPDDTFPGCYRNRFVTDPDSPDGTKCQHLVSIGFMHDHGKNRITGSMHTYTVTRQGFEAVKRHSPKPPPTTKAQRRWAAFRDLRDARDMTFRQYLSWPGRQAHEELQRV